ncbi:hypothetical protein BX616_009051, partial [Lobosporangium transversale]
MTKISPLYPNKEETLLNSNASVAQGKTEKTFSRCSSYEAPIQGNKLVLEKDEAYDLGHHEHNYRDPFTYVDTASTFGEEVVMESGFRGYLVVLGGFLTIMVAIGYVSIY